MSNFSFNGVDLTPFLNFIKVDRSVGNSRDVKTDDSPAVGENIQDVKISGKVLKVRVSLASFDHGNIRFVDTIESSSASRGTIDKLREKVAGLLHTSVARRLELPTESDRYYMALPRGDVELEGITDWYDETVIEFFVPDGVAHATSYKRVIDPQIAGNKAVFTIQNDGNQPAFPIVTANHSSDNGYIGLVNTTGAMEVGNIEEIDSQTVQKSKILRDYKTGTNIVNGLADAQKNVAVYNSTQNLAGTISRLDLWGRPHLRLSNSGGTTGNNGSSLTWSVPADVNGEIGSLNDYIWWRQIFWAGSVEQYGMIKLVVSDTDGNFLYAIETIKRSKGLGAEYNVIATDGEGGYNILKGWPFKATDKDTENPFNQNRGFCDVLRRDEVIQVYFWGDYKKYYIPAIKGKKTGKFHIIFSAIGNRPLVTHMYLDQIMYRKDFINTFENLPNLFSSGTSLVLNSENDTAFIDHVIANKRVVDTSDWLVIPPGKSTMEVYCSDWATMPEISINFEERWL